MVSPELIYLKFLTKINKGNTQGDIACDKDRFVLIFNEVKNRWVEKNLKVKDSILIDSLWEIVKTEQLNKGVDKGDYQEFYIPDDFYELILTQSDVVKDSCKKKIYLREVKNQDKNILSFNLNYKPDFEFVFVYDNEKRNKEMISRVEKTIDMKFPIVIWPQDLKCKDINDMILAGLDVEKIIKDNTFMGLVAKAKLIGWKRV